MEDFDHLPYKIPPEERALLEAAKDFQRVRYQKGVSRDEYKRVEAAFGKAVNDLIIAEESDRWNP